MNQLLSYFTILPCGLLLLALPGAGAADLLRPPILSWALSNGALVRTKSLAQPIECSHVPQRTQVPASKHQTTSPRTVPVPLAPPAEPHPSAVGRLLAFQADGVAPGDFQPIPGVEAVRSYQSWLKTFQQTSPSSPSPVTPTLALPKVGMGSYG